MRTYEMVDIFNVDNTDQFISFTVRTSRFDSPFNVFLKFDSDVSDKWRDYFQAIYQVRELEEGGEKYYYYRPVGAAARPETELNATSVAIVVQSLEKANENTQTPIPSKYARLQTPLGRDVFIPKKTMFGRTTDPDPASSTISDSYPINVSYDVDVAERVQDNSIKVEPKCWKLMNSKAWSLARLRVSTRRLDSNVKFVLSYDLSELKRKVDDNSVYTEILSQFKIIKSSFENQATEQINLYNGESDVGSERFDFSFPCNRYRRINFNFSHNTAELLQEKVAKGERLLVPAKLMFVDGNVESEKTEFFIEIMPQTDTDGTLAIDCGTSSCVAYLYDPNHEDDKSLNAPKEQVEFLAEHMKKWVDYECAQSADAARKAVWRQLVVDVLHELQANFKDDQNLQDYLKKSRHFDQYETNAGLFQFLYQFEKLLRNRSELVLSDSPERDFYVYFVNKFYQIYRRSFDQYSFSDSKLNGVLLGEDGRLEATSEFKYEGINPVDGTPFGQVGEDIAAERKSAQASFDYWNNEERPYEQSPKDLIHSLYRVGSEERKRYFAFLKAVVSKAMKGYSSKNGRFLPRLLATYPATLLSESRRELKEMFLQMGFPQVDLAYDESVAPAIFYLDKMCGYFDDYGPEAFKACCTRIGDAWYHNMLVVDVGAGTTDVSVIQVKLTEAYPINNGSEEYLPGGRNYEITPYLLGASGNPQVAGNFLTLKIFYRLKALLVAYKISCSDKTTADEQKKTTINAQEQDFVNNLYASERVDLTLKERDQVKQALRIVEKYLPTSYLRVATGDGALMPVEEKVFGERCKRFNVLWELAERLKIAFSEELGKGIKENFNLLRLPLGEHWTEIFGAEVAVPINETSVLSFKFSDFETLASNVVSKICGIAENLTNESLRVREENNPCLKDACQGVDSIILSGCSSKLPQMRRAFDDAIKESITQVEKRFATSRTKILFEDQYAKSATAVGALRGANVKSVSPINVNGALEVVQGFCSRRIDVQNLSFFLPADFKGGKKVFFKMQTQFEQVGLLNERSIFWDSWDALPDGEIAIDKSIGEIDSHSNYAELSRPKIQKEIEEARGKIEDADEELKNAFARFDPKRVRYSLEINSEQDIFVLLARSDENDDVQIAYTTLIPGLDSPRSDNVSVNLTKSVLDSKTAKACFQVVNGQIKLIKRLKICNGGVAINWTFPNEKEENDRYEVLIDNLCYLGDDFKKGAVRCAWFEPKIVSENQTQVPLEIDFDHPKTTIQTIDGEVLANFDLSTFYKSLKLEEYSFDLKSIKFNVLLSVQLKSDRNEIDKAQFHLFVGKRPQYALAKNYRQWIEYDGLVYRERINKDVQPRQSELNPFTGLH